MKKSTFNFFALALSGVALAVAPLHAQQGKNPFLSKSSSGKTAEIARQYMQSKIVSTQNKPTATKQRVVAQAAYEQGVMEDSTVYVYSGSRGSEYNYYDFDFSYSRQLEIDRPEYPIRSWGNNAFPDTLYSYEQSAIPVTVYMAHYRDDNQMDTLIRGYNGVSGFNYDKVVNSFDNDGKLIRSAGMNLDNTFIHSETVYSYNDNKMPTSDSTFRLSGSGRELYELMTYSYDGNGNMDTIARFIDHGNGLKPETMAALTYNSANEVATMDHYRGNGNAWELEEKNIFTYHTSFGIYKTWSRQEYDNGVVDNSTDVEVHLGSHGYPDSLTAITTEQGSADSLVLHFTYNAEMNPTRIEVAFVGTGKEVMSRNFYYENYEAEDPNSIAKVKNINVRVAPNPFVHDLTLTLADAKTSPYTIRLYDVLGRIVFSESKVLSEGTTSLNIPSVPTGAYILRVLHPEAGDFSAQLIRK